MDRDDIMLILRNQRAIMKHLVTISRDPVPELIEQAKETVARLRACGELKPKERS